MAITSPKLNGARMQVLDALRTTPVFAIVRGVPEALLLDTALALAAGGVTALEVTADTRGWFDALASWRDAIGPGVSLGVGTVIDPTVAQAAIDAGADFVVSPNTDERVIEVARDAGIDIIAGALTPTEIVRAHQAGATAVKVFPVSAVGGPRYIASLAAPLSHIALVSVGGVRPDDVVDYLNAGAFAAGLGLSLVERELVETRRFAELERRARAVIDEVTRARQ